MHDKYQNRQNHTNYKNTSPIEDSAEKVDASIVTEMEPQPVNTPDEIFYGTVINCTKLNVREQPSKNATVITVIPANAEVVIDLGESTEDFYKICHAVGIEGFCMKQYIELKA